MAPKTRSTVEESQVGGTHLEESEGEQAAVSTAMENRLSSMMESLLGAVTSSIRTAADKAVSSISGGERLGEETASSSRPRRPKDGYGPKFSGKRVEFRDWLGLVEMHLSQYTMTEEAKVLYVGLNLLDETP